MSIVGPSGRNHRSPNNPTKTKKPKQGNFLKSIQANMRRISQKPKAKGK